MCWYCTGPWFNIKMSSYQYRKSHCGDKTVARSSYLHSGISYTGKMTTLCWISPPGRPKIYAPDPCCCGLLWFGSSGIYPYPSGSCDCPHVPVKQPWRIWGNAYINLPRTKHNNIVFIYLDILYGNGLERIKAMVRVYKIITMFRVTSASCRLSSTATRLFL